MLKQISSYTNHDYNAGWSGYHCILYNGLLRMTFKPTKFICDYMTKEMGIVLDVKKMWKNMGLGTLGYNSEPMYPELVIQFLSSVELHYKSEENKVASENKLTFLSSGVLYEMSIHELCTLFRFETKHEACSLPKFPCAFLLWNKIADSFYVSREAKLAMFRNPVLRVTVPLVKVHSNPTVSVTSTISRDTGSAMILTGSDVAENTTVHVNSTDEIFQDFTVLPPKKSLPSLPDYSQSNQGTKTSTSNTPPKGTRSTTIPLLPRSAPTSNPNTNSNPINHPPSAKSPPNHPPSQTWAQKARPIADKTLKRLVPLTYSEAGIPQVVVPDEVFHRGAEMPKEFIIGSFLAKMPSYQAIQSVLNFLWGKGQKLDIRTNLQQTTILVRIPNEFTRKKF
ncbi:hypothetical protein Bca4012_084516 [Brassica carinata]